MLVQLQPIQVSLLWGEVLHSAVQANQISGEKRERYGEKLLENLLLGRFQAWVCYSMSGEERKIHAIGITSIIGDQLRGENNIHIHSLYGFRTLTEELALESFSAFRSWAKANNCTGIIAETFNDRIKELCQLVGLKPRSFTFYSEV